MVHSIRLYQEEDQSALVEIWYHAVLQTHTFLKEEDFNFYYQLVRGGALNEVEKWIYCDNEKRPLGFIGVDGSKVEMLFVSPGHHGRGIGTRLLRHAQQVKGLHLQVDVNEQNEQAVRFYTRYGFAPEGRSAVDASGRPYPLIHMAIK
ncbi:GNAT family N-acetyltransferase [Paenibacillus chartarius]|uniref:GNAT family N-acetyltransferase n=1 Tax=Paenibacillus chartarius TaxID=747481 RepID=A0ABV6DJV4_9BACL